MGTKTGMMEIALGNGIIEADAKTGMVNLRSIEKLGMAMSGVENVRDYSKRLSLWVELVDTKEFIETLSLVKNSSLSELHYKEGKRNYKHWGNLHIALKYAMYVNKELEIEVIDTFITKKILDFRLLGIDYYKELNDRIDKLPDRLGKSNKGCYIQLSKAVNMKCNGGEFIAGWDYTTDTAEVQKYRADILDFVNKAIDMGLANSYLEVKNLIEKYKDIK